MIILAALMAFEISYAGIDFKLDTAEVREILRAGLPIEDLRVSNQPSSSWGPLNYRGPSLPFPSWPAYPRLRLGQFFYPAGASRWGVFHGILEKTSVEEMKAKVYTSSSQPAEFVIQADPDDGDTKAKTGIRTQMHMLPPRPAFQIDQDLEGLWIVTLVDERWNWQASSAGSQTISPGITWGDLLSACATALGITLDQGNIDSVYGSPASESLLYSHYENAAQMLDCCAWNVGKIVVRNWDGTYKLQTPAEAQTAITASRSEDDLAGGDAFEVYPADSGASRARNAVLPAKVTVVYPKWVTDSGPVDTRPTGAFLKPSYGDVYARDTTLAQAGYFIAGFTGNQVLRNTAKAVYAAAGDADPANKTQLDALALRLAQDFYEARLNGLDESYPGIRAWDPDGLNDILIDYTIDACRTRVLGRPWNQGVIDFCHAGASAGTVPTNLTPPVTIPPQSPPGNPAPPQLVLPPYPPGTNIQVIGVAGSINLVNVNGQLTAVVVGASGTVKTTCILCGGAGCACCKAGCSPKPQLADLSWVNQGDAQRYVNANESITLFDPSGSVSPDLHLLVHDLPAGTPWRIDYELVWTPGNHAGQPWAGVVLRESGSGKLHVWGVQMHAGTSGGDVGQFAGSIHQLTMHSLKYAGPDTPDGEYREHRLDAWPAFWRLEHDGTDRVLWYSQTGHPQDWIEFDRQTAADYLDADQAGVFVDASESQGVALVICCLKARAQSDTGYEYQTTASEAADARAGVGYEYEARAVAVDALAETTYEYETAASEHDVDARAEAGYEYEAAAYEVPAIPLPPTICIDSTIGTHQTLTSQTPTLYTSTTFSYDSQTVYWYMYWDTGTQQWLVDLRTSPGDTVLGTYAYDSNDLSTIINDSAAESYYKCEESSGNRADELGVAPDLEEERYDGGTAGIDADTGKVGSAADLAIGDFFGRSITLGSGDWSISAWVYLKSSLNPAGNNIYQLIGLAGQNAGAAARNGSTVEFHFGVDSQTAVSTVEPTLDAWFHVYVQYVAASKKAGIAVNGETLVESSAFGGTHTPFEPAGMVIGCGTGQVGGLLGLLDELVIRKGSGATLSPNQLAAMYNGGNGVDLAVSDVFTPTIDNTFTLASGSLPVSSITVTKCP